MDPTVVAAWIAAGVSVLTLAGTLAAQYFGYHASSRDAEKTAEEQRKQLDQAQAAQREQLDRTLAEQREQLDRTLVEQRTRTLNERFATAAEQLGSDKPAVGLAGVYAMAGLADDWEENRQTCVDVLCAYLQLPYAPDPGSEAPELQRLAFQASQKVRHTVIRVIAAHLREHAAVSWQGLNFDFTGVVFDGGDFTWARFSGGKVDFSGARFTSGTVDFSSAGFSGAAEVRFHGARFSGGTVCFRYAWFWGGFVDFTGAGFFGGKVDFAAARFSGALVIFHDAEFSGGKVSFDGIEVTDQAPADFLSNARFPEGTVFAGGSLFFNSALFSGGTVYFRGAGFSGGTVDFSFSEFSGGTVDFADVDDWSVPPAFPWTDTPPPGVKLPKKQDQTQA
jgi:uncharacterized protein YjbI with pentapeptide repeats